MKQWNGELILAQNEEVLFEQGVEVTFLEQNLQEELSSPWLILKSRGNNYGTIIITSNRLLYKANFLVRWLVPLIDAQKMVQPIGITGFEIFNTEISSVFLVSQLALFKSCRMRTIDGHTFFINVGILGIKKFKHVLEKALGRSIG